MSSRSMSEAPPVRAALPLYTERIGLVFLEQGMHTLSPEDMARIVNCGELFLLVDVRPDSAIGVPLTGAVRVLFPSDTFVSDVLLLAGQRELPVVVVGDGENCPLALQAAAQLKDAGFAETWVYCGDPLPWDQRRQPVVVDRFSVVTDPDAPTRHRHRSVERPEPTLSPAPAF